MGSSLEKQKWGEQEDSKWKAPEQSQKKTTRTDGDETQTSVGEEAQFPMNRWSWVWGEMEWMGRELVAAYIEEVA